MSDNIESKDNSLTEETRFLNRKRMAWTSLYSLMAIILLFFFAPIPETRLTIIAEPLAMISFGLVGVVAAFMGFTSMEKWKLGQ